MPDQLPAIQWGMIAGISDHGGGRRVVMGEPLHMTFHVGPGEKAFPAPGLHAMHDIWNHKEWIIWQGEKAVLDGTRGGCGSCRACCITLYIADEGDGFTKPSHRACHNLCNAGCRIYDARPRTCSSFRCVWLKSQGGNRAMDPELRPDRCGAILTDHDEGATRVHVDPSYPKSAALQAFITAREAEGEAFAPVTHYYGEG